MSSNILMMALTAFVLIQLLMFVLWLNYKSKHNAGIVDVGWALSFTIAAAVYFIMGDGYWLRAFIITLMVFIWSLRLAAHLFTRYTVMKEDPRYVRIREGWPNKKDLRMLFMFLFQGGIAFVLSSPFLIANLNRSPYIDGYEVFGMLLWLMGLVGESHADWTLAQFKKNPENHQKVCQEGLWAYSRHPNYFFEWVVWLGFFAFVLNAPGGWVAVYCPFLILHLLLNVSGVPLTELQLLQSKGEVYKKYQMKTSYFIPWPPKEEKKS